MVCRASAEPCTEDRLLPTRWPIHSSCDSSINNAQSFTQRLAAALNYKVIAFSASPFLEVIHEEMNKHNVISDMPFFLWPPFRWIIIQGWKPHAKLSKPYLSLTQHSLDFQPSSLGNLFLLQTKRVTTEKWNMLFLLNLTISSASTMAGDHGKTLWLCHKLQWVWKISELKWPPVCKDW